MKLYEFDGHISEFYAKVLSCNENSNGNFEILLDKSAFFPEGGGQSSDEGTIDNNDVISLFLDEKQENVIHIISKPLEVGKEVFCKINKEKRFSDMQNHTAEHIVSGIINKIFGYDNIGFHMGENEITMDFNGLFTKEELDDIEIRANKVVYDNVQIKIKHIEPSNDENIVYRSKKEITSKIRLVEIEGVDVCACCAPHVSKTGEIGIIKLLGAQKYKNGTRISMLAGERAYNELKKHFDNVKLISNSLSSHPDMIVENFKNLSNEIMQLKTEKSFVKEKYFSLLSEKYNSNDKVVILFEEDLDFNDLRRLVNALMVKTDGICAAFSKNDVKYNFVIGSKMYDLTELTNIFRTQLNSSCGGKKEMIQGTVLASKEMLDTIINSAIK